MDLENNATDQGVTIPSTYLLGHSVFQQAGKLRGAEALGPATIPELYNATTVASIDYQAHHSIAVFFATFFANF